MTGFMFATGVENSYPTIDGGRKRVDEMEKCGHYTHWKRDFDCVRELGIRRAFGASRSRIFVAVMLESVVGTVVAGTIGIGLCIFAYRLPIVQETLTQGIGGVVLPGFPMGAAVTGLLVSAAVGALAGSIPATIAVRSKVIEAIRF